MKIAVDAFGGDYAPDQIVEGALQAAHLDGAHIILVGTADRLRTLVEGKPGQEHIEIEDAPEVIGMEEAPVEAVRKKKNSSLVTAAALVRDGSAVGMVSAGSPGAAMAASLFGIGRIKGVERPAITSLMPTLKGVCLLADVGANVDCRASQLVQFAQMGSIYSQRALGVRQPKVGLLNVGEEPSKGNEAVQKAYEILQTCDLDFVGNMEGRDIPKGDVDVVICDGFVGNIVLKFAEGLGSALFGMMKEEFTKTALTKAGALLLKPGLRQIRKRMDYTEYGGAPLLGVQGISIIAHGSSNAKAIRNAIRVALEAAENQVVDTIAETMAGE